MFTRKVLNILLNAVYNELTALGLKPVRMILFGSYAKENVHEYSDVDLAIWHDRFTGVGLIDLELIRPILRKHRGLDIKMYPANATASNFDPFIDEIEHTGLLWDEEKGLMRLTLKSAN